MVREMPPNREILIIEDDPDTIQLLQVVLKTGNYHPVPALGGKPGLKQLQGLEPDLILLDLMMDDVDGWTVLEKIRANADWDPIPIIILSVKNPLEDPRRMKDHAGMFSDYVVKPFNVRDLLDRIDRAIAGEINPLFRRRDVRVDD
jgi:DNA-binding response OmpR family regulator